MGYNAGKALTGKRNRKLAAKIGKSSIAKAINKQIIAKIQSARRGGIVGRARRGIRSIVRRR